MPQQHSCKPRKRSGRRTRHSVSALPLRPLMTTGVGRTSRCTRRLYLVARRRGAPQQRCWLGHQVVDTGSPGINVPGTVVRGVVGGIPGHRIGSWRGQALATGIGAAGGATVGATVGATWAVTRRHGLQPGWAALRKRVHGHIGGLLGHHVKLPRVGASCADHEPSGQNHLGQRAGQASRLTTEMSKRCETGGRALVVSHGAA
jgi:hypothetical protein